MELRYGTKPESIHHFVGPWDWTEDQIGLTFEGREGFVVMQEEDGAWVLCYNRNGDHLKSFRGKGRVMEVELDRRILPIPR